jgi:hypothetical protein
MSGAVRQEGEATVAIASMLYIPCVLIRQSLA